MKTCNTCNQEKPETSFHKNRQYKDGRLSCCIACVKAKRREKQTVKQGKKETACWADSILHSLSGRDY